MDYYLLPNNEDRPSPNEDGFPKNEEEFPKTEEQLLKNEERISNNEGEIRKTEEQIPKTEEKPKEEINPMTQVENMKNWIQNKEKTKLVEFICKLSNEDRQKFKEIYLANYGTELTKELESLLSGDVKNLILGLMKTSVEFDAEKIYLSMKGAGTDEEVLSEMIATRPSRQLVKIKEKYPEIYDETLEKAIEGDTSSYYKKILIAMIQGGRSDNPYPNSQKMKEIVEKLKDDDENVKENFLSYLITCSYGEICTICREYEKAYGKNILEGIKDKFSSDEYNFFDMLLNHISDPGKFFAEKIHGFKSKDLIRIIVSRSEENLDEIKDAYRELYNVELIDDIKGQTEGDFQIGLSILLQK